MFDIFYKCNDFISKDYLFWFCALFGSGLFVIQFLLSFISGQSHDDVDIAGEDVDSGNFKWISKHAITGFLMMFGWVGLTCRNEFNISSLYSFLLSFLSGIITMFFTSLVFRGANKLQSSGTIFTLDDAIGKHATIYQRIPKGGIGKISISLHNFTHEIDAISDHPEDLQSFTSVQIIKKSDDKTVLVVPIQ